MNRETHHHRAGHLKQSNKVHKTGRHRSKSELKNEKKGKVATIACLRKKKTQLGREARRNQMIQIRNNKRQEVLATKRSLNSVPHMVCILPLNKLIDPGSVMSFITQFDEEADIKTGPTGATHIFIPRFKQRFSFLIPDFDDYFSLLDTVKVCDTVLFVISAVAGFDFGDEVIDEWGFKVLSLLMGQHMPNTLTVITEMEGVPVKKRDEQKRNIQKTIDKWLPNEKIMFLNKNGDMFSILQKICNQKRAKVYYRDQRPYLFAEHVLFETDSEGELGTLKVSGYLRGTALSANDLVHIPGLGDFQMRQIEAPVDPFLIKKKSKNQGETNNTVSKSIIIETEDSTIQESLESEIVPDDDMENSEQTWPTEEEFKMAEKEQKLRKVKVPAGFSDYQASWVIDEINESDSLSEEENDQDEYMDAASEKDSYEDNESEFPDNVTESEVGIEDTDYDKRVNWDNEVEELEKLKAAQSDFQFPDEVDTPKDIPARLRFQKYRVRELKKEKENGSEWDSNENLPRDYGRIIRFKNFQVTKHVLIKNQKNRDTTYVNTFLTIHVKGVPKNLWNNFQSTNAPLILFGLFPYEHKMSVVNVVLKRTPNYEVPIKSKERLIFQCGYRRFIVQPIFSEHNNRKEHKFLRFFQEPIAVATFYAQVQFPPAPVLCFKEINNKLILISTGQLLSCDPNRLIIKKVILSGHPFKIHKNIAVIRYMFFNREDILHFKNLKAELRTKYGKVGEIREPLGTRGHMKCCFQKMINSMDTVLMHLYKRVFPKWSYEECISLCTTDKLQNMES